MELTIEERQAIEKGDVLKDVIPGSRVGCVVMREDLLDPLRARLDYSACDTDDLTAMTAEVLADEDWRV
jgi:DNA-binding transcriptional MocR family regulator